VNLRKRYTFLEPFPTPKYGSAAFVPSKRSCELELRVSTTGLLFRPAAVEDRREWLN